MVVAQMRRDEEMNVGMMFRRSYLSLLAVAVLAACQPAIPDSAAGVGFEDSFAQQQRARDAALAASVAQSAPVPAAPIDDGSPEATAAETARVLAATRAGTAAPSGSASVSTVLSNSGIAPVVASPSNPAPPVVNTAGISNENNFDAVADQRSIDADAARIAANRAQYEVVQPQALPTRTSTGPNIVAYAISTSHARGTQIYSRGGFNRDRKFQRACAQYTSQDQAQIDFLAAGGPESDRAGVDPDGDGFACNWDPAPFRRAAQG